MSETNVVEVPVDIDGAWVILGPDGKWFEIHRKKDDAEDALEEHYGVGFTVLQITRKGKNIDTPKSGTLGAMEDN